MYVSIQVEKNLLHMISNLSLRLNLKKILHVEGHNCMTN